MHNISKHFLKGQAPFSCDSARLVMRSISIRTVSLRAFTHNPLGFLSGSVSGSEPASKGLHCSRAPTNCSGEDTASLGSGRDYRLSQRELIVFLPLKEHLIAGAALIYSGGILMSPFGCVYMSWCSKVCRGPSDSGGASIASPLCKL